MAKNFKGFSLSKGSVKRPKQITTRAQRLHQSGMTEKRGVNAAGNKRSKLFDLRVEVLKREREVGRKISRHTQRGVNLANSEHNPLRPNANIAGYTDKQLRTYLYHMNEFMKRGNQFEGDAFGNPLPRKKVNEWKREARKSNQRIDGAIQRVKDVEVIPGGETYGERYDRLSRRSRLSNGNQRWSRINVETVAFFGEKQLDQAIKDLKKRNKLGLNHKPEHNIREHFAKLSEYTGRKDISELANKLDDDVFEFMFKFSPLINESLDVYALWKKLQGKRQNSEAMAMLDDQLSDIKGLLEYEYKTKNIRRRL